MLARSTECRRGFAARKREEDAAKCFPFGGRGEVETETSLPPMDPPRRSRWWAHELAALRARPAVCAAGGEAAIAVGKGDGSGMATKRKGSRASGCAERAKKPQRALQLSFCKHKVLCLRFVRPPQLECSLAAVLWLLKW
jgi:hypothetical protein